MRVVADPPGELHLHSSPEQQIEYPAGTTDKTLAIEQPGLVAWSRTPWTRLVAQLEVR